MNAENTKIDAADEARCTFCEDGSERDAKRVPLGLEAKPCVPAGATRAVHEELEHLLVRLRLHEYKYPYGR